MDIRTREAVRYLGYGSHAIDERTLELIQQSFGELDECSGERFVYRIFELSFLDIENLKVNYFNIQSRNLVKNLHGCQSCIVFGITLGAAVDRVLQKYERIQIAIALELYAKRGAEAQTGHSENGINRTYEAGDVSPSLLKQIIPMVAGVTVHENP